MDLSFIKIVPLVGGHNVAIIDDNVVLPAPLTPNNANNSTLYRSTATPSSALNITTYGKIWQYGQIKPLDLLKETACIRKLLNESIEKEILEISIIKDSKSFQSFKVSCIPYSYLISLIPHNRIILDAFPSVKFAGYQGSEDRHFLGLPKDASAISLKESYRRLTALWKTEYLYNSENKRYACIVLDILDIVYSRLLRRNVRENPPASYIYVWQSLRFSERERTDDWSYDMSEVILLDVDTEKDPLRLLNERFMLKKLLSLNQIMKFFIQCDQQLVTSLCRQQNNNDTTPANLALANGHKDISLRIGPTIDIQHFGHLINKNRIDIFKLPRISYSLIEISGKRRSFFRGEKNCCSHCAKEIVKDPFFCNRCKLLLYCSKDCQLADWKVNHKIYCVPMK